MYAVLVAVDRKYLPEVWFQRDCLRFESECHDYTMLREGQTWRIYHKNSACVVADAASRGQHPVTIHRGEWRLFDPISETMADTTLLFTHEKLESCPAFPLTMDTLGLDFFMRNKTNAIVWYIDPSNGELCHSGSKQIAGHPGKRFCAHCYKSFSANNFCYQHMRCQHPTLSRANSPIVECIFIDEL